MESMDYLTKGDLALFEHYHNDKNPRIVIENKEVKTIKTKKSKGIKCKTCQENK